MIQIKINQNYKSIKEQDVFELPEFCVMTGKNGSGKSHLLEAIAKVDISTVVQDGARQQRLKYIPFGGLTPQVKSDCSHLQLIKDRKNAWNNLNQQLLMHKNSSWAKTNNWEAVIHDEYQRRIIRHLIQYTDGNAWNIDEEIFNAHYDVFGAEMFSAQMADIFKLYYERKENNDYHRYIAEVKREPSKYLSDEEFEKTYGPAPWTLINEMLKNADLSYEVNHPEGDKENDFHLKLRDPIRNIDIQVNDLSTGEKVLMSLALAIYNTTESGEKPDVLMLDEPDAPLHPEYSKLLIDTIKTSIVEKAKVAVIITTHSPTTVAMADEESLYKMDKDLGHPEKTTKIAALKLLMEGLRNLRVSADARRQIFVESKYDVHYYEQLFSLVVDNPVIKPYFLAPGSGTTNCSDVISMVSQLTSQGNDLVYGIIDYDGKNKSTDRILVSGEGKRYTIENYLLDPLFIACLLIREKVAFTDTSISLCRYSDIKQQKNSYLQQLIDAVETSLGFTGDNVQYTVLNKMQFTSRLRHFEIPGHDLEELLLKTWPGLNAVKRGRSGDNVFKDYMIDNIVSDFPEFISKDFMELFGKIK